MSIALFCSVLTMPYSVMLAMRARKNPAMKNYYLRRLIMLPIVPFASLLVSGFIAENHLKYLSDKYFAHLNDNDLDNFEVYYQLRKGA